MTGLLGVLIQAKRNNLIKNVKPLIDDLRRIGFRLNQRLVENVLSELGEV
ncbi:MAG: DUF3368 domain-containing protein [Saprospiraceae bacterium]